MSEKVINILVVDDHPIVAQGIIQLLENEKDIKVCSIAENANKALEIINRENPDMAIIDISLKDGMGGLELTKSIKSIRSDFPVLILSMHDESLYAERAIRAGARGYVMKDQMTQTIIKAIRQVMDGKIFLSEDMSFKLLDELMFNKREKTLNFLDNLTDRELEVFQFIGQGYKTQEIADRLCLSAKTIDTYRMRIKEKLSLNDSNELIKVAIEWVHKNIK